jgi:DNA-binding SARP family transcriptional activator
LGLLAKAQVSLERGRRRQAREDLDAAFTTIHRIKARYLEFAALLVEALIAFDQREEAAAKVALEKALSMGKARAYIIAMLIPYKTVARLCIKALEHDIEVDYVHETIQARNLVPEHPPLHLENWPWPLKVHTLGRFGLIRDDKPVRFSGKAQKKPIALLKCLIALGGRQVDEARLADQLWPDADGDMAHHRLTTTLYRLRKLLGHHEALEAQEGHLTLNPRYCWVDAWAFGRATARAADAWKQAAKEGDFSEAIALSRKAIAFYRGQFLQAEADEPWVFSMREQLRSRYVRQVEKLGHRLEEVDNVEEALDLYLKVLEIDETAERIYRRLMICHRRLGQHAEAMSVYNRCKRVLSESLGIQPSSVTEEIRNSLFG